MDVRYCDTQQAEAILSAQLELIYQQPELAQALPPIMSIGYLRANGHAIRTDVVLFCLMK